MRCNYGDEVMVVIVVCTFILIISGRHENMGRKKVALGFIISCMFFEPCWYIIFRDIFSMYNSILVSSVDHPVWKLGMTAVTTSSEKKGSKAGIETGTKIASITRDFF